MKLLFDANLSPKLVKRLEDLFPGLTHVFETGLARFMPDTGIRTADVEDLIRRNAVRIAEFEVSDRALLILRKVV